MPAHSLHSWDSGPDLPCASYLICCGSPWSDPTYTVGRGGITVTCKKCLVSGAGRIGGTSSGSLLGVVGVALFVGLCGL